MKPQKCSEMNFNFEQSNKNTYIWEKSISQQLKFRSLKTFAIDNAKSILVSNFKAKFNCHKLFLKTSSSQEISLKSFDSSIMSQIKINSKKIYHAVGGIKKLFSVDENKIKQKPTNQKIMNKPEFDFIKLFKENKIIGRTATRKLDKTLTNYQKHRNNSYFGPNSTINLKKIALKQLHYTGLKNSPKIEIKIPFTKIFQSIGDIKKIFNSDKKKNENAQTQSQTENKNINEKNENTQTQSQTKNKNINEKNIKKKEITQMNKVQSDLLKFFSLNINKIENSASRKLGRNLANLHKYKNGSDFWNSFTSDLNEIIYKSLNTTLEKMIDNKLSEITNNRISYYRIKNLYDVYNNFLDIFINCRKENLNLEKLSYSFLKSLFYNYGIQAIDKIIEQYSENIPGINDIINYGKIINEVYSLVSLKEEDPIKKNEKKNEIILKLSKPTINLLVMNIIPIPFLNTTIHAFVSTLIENKLKADIIEIKYAIKEKYYKNFLRFTLENNLKKFGLQKEDINSQPKQYIEFHLIKNVRNENNITNTFRNQNEFINRSISEYYLLSKCLTINKI